MKEDGSAEILTDSAMGLGEMVRRLARMCAQDKTLSLIVAGCLLVEVAFSAALAYSFKFIIDEGLAKGDVELLIRVIALLVFGVVLATLAGLGKDYYLAKLLANMLARLRLGMFEKFQWLPQRYYARNQLGDLLNRFSSDIATVENMLGAAIPWAIQPGLDVIASTVLLFLLDWRMALLSLLVWPIALIGPRSFVPRASAAAYTKRKEEGGVMSHIQENLSGQALVKALNFERNAIRGFESRNHGLAASTRRVGFLSSLVERSSTAGIHIVQVTVLGAGAYLAFTGTLTVGALAAFMTLFVTLSYSLLYVAQYTPQLIQGSGAMRRIADVIDSDEDIRDDAGTDDLPPLRGEIAYRRVTFGYGGDTLALNDVSLTVPAGRSVAFVGASGSGKSTLINLLMRFYDPAQGSLLWDGTDLRTVSLQALRARTGIVFQDNFIFNIPLLENIRMARPEAADAEVEAAARAAEMHDFIAALPDGYRTLAGERGGRLSGGQRQRIGIARAVLRNPELLILDEATSALDPATEDAINQTLERAASGRTVVCVTHRLASVARYDRIYVLDHGKLVERGTHAELMALNGYYRALWEKQHGFTVAAEGDARISPARLKAVELLAGLDDALLGELSERFASESVAAGRVIVHEGDAGERIYFIAHGKVEVVRRDPAHAKETIVATLQDGDHFGEIALLKRVPRTASVRTLTPCLLLSLTRAQFNLLLDRAPEIRERLRDSVRLRLND